MLTLIVLNADRLTKSARLEIKKKRLHIKEVEPSDNGVYRCVAENEAGIQQSSKKLCTGCSSCVGIRSESAEVPQSYTAELKLAFLEPFTANSFEPPLPEYSQKIIGEGSLFQLTCLEPNSLPPAKKWWENPKGHTISDTGDIRVDDGRLIIDNITMDNGGKYKCVAESIAGKTEHSVEIIVTSKPEITSNPISVTVDENKKSILSCGFESKSLPYTVVKWRKDGKLLKHDYDDSSSSHQRIRIYKHNGTLIIHNTQTSDRGEYVCEVITTGQEPLLSKPATVSVIEQLKFAPAPVNKKMELGSVAKIHCKAQGTPPPIIRWEKEGLTSENFANHITDMNGTLHFNGVLAADNGIYNCIASNSQGVINASITIDVVVAPKFSILPKNPTEIVEGQSVMMDCVVEGDPKPTIHWDKNLKMNDFDLSRFRVLPNGTLHISEVHREDENTYGCTAGSSAGLNRKEVQLIVHSKDGYHPETDGDSTVTKAVLITMSVAGAYIVLVIGLMVWCRYRRRSRKLPIGDVPKWDKSAMGVRCRNKRKNSYLTFLAAKTENGDVEHTELKEGANGSAPGPSKVKANGIESHKEGQKSDGAETTNSQTLSRSHLKDIKLIGRGEFGDVMVAKIAKSVLILDKRNSLVTTPTDPPAEDKDLPVLVKALTQTKDENCLAEFKRELDMFTKLSHENITKLYGLCREEEPHYLISEHTDWGDLKKFLMATQNGSPPALTPVQSVGILHQLSRGMDHLANNRLVHKDLAARNCLVSSTLVAKIGLPRLTRDPYSQEYCKHVNHVIPLRWLPYEAVYEDEYSTKSDMYAFGVIIWEIFAQGELPQSKINDNSFLNKLKEKKLEWKAHPSTPEVLIKIQDSCWDVDPKNRPSFSEVSKELEEILKSM
ncbi:hypothetical protein NQ314_017619 [Rhamnusium bicolor]|uniref:Tyrosine-protein kinase-like otk n=1 Tax=Rhamnusium bicolor TaxID=1586634 RepID=A0AAV8WSX2_9CUCU|nr:hypothetical protein NQ314_017619 [Rhamnusium bicolor]